MCPMCEVSKSLPCDGAEKPSYPRFVASNKSWSKYDSPVVRVHFSLDKLPKSLRQLLTKETHSCHTCDWQISRGDQSSEYERDTVTHFRQEISWEVVVFTQLCDTDQTSLLQFVVHLFSQTVQIRATHRTTQLTC